MAREKLAGSGWAFSIETSSVSEDGICCLASASGHHPSLTMSGFAKPSDAHRSRAPQIVAAKPAGHFFTKTGGAPLIFRSCFLKLQPGREPSDTADFAGTRLGRPPGPRNLNLGIVGNISRTKGTLMNRLRIAPLFAIATLGAALAQAADKPVHIFILSGQSNMAGMDPKLGFEPEANELFADGEVVYFKVARGGQPIRYWVEQWDEIAAKHGIDAQAKRARDKNKGTIYYQPILEQYQAVIAKHPQPASVTFCWMQGERDAKEGLSAAYADALTQLIENLRRDLKQPEMNFVIGRLSDFGKPDNAHWQAVRKAQVDVAAKDPRGAWADCDDLNDKLGRDGTKRDDLHYTREGYELLGRRYARQAKALVDGEEPADNGRPE
jgi:hypothetical protein